MVPPVAVHVMAGTRVVPFCLVPRTEKARLAPAVTVAGLGETVRLTIGERTLTGRDLASALPTSAAVTASRPQPARR